MTDEFLAGQPTPEPPATAQPNAATTTTQTDGVEGGNEGPEQEERKFTQSELDEILRKRVAKAEGRAERRVMRTVERMLGQQQPQQAPQQQQRTEDPLARRDGESDSDFVRRAVRVELEQRDKHTAAERQQSEAKTLAEKTDRIYADAQKLDGFDREAFDDLPLTKPIVEALIDSDNAPGLMKHLADNPDEVERIAKLSPARQAAELGRMEASLQAAPKKTTPLPEPINPLRRPSGGKPAYDTTDPRSLQQMGTSAWIEADRKRRAAAGLR